MFFPQARDLVNFKMEGKNIDVLPPEEPDSPLWYLAFAREYAEAWKYLTLCFK